LLKKIGETMKSILAILSIAVIYSTTASADSTANKSFYLGLNSGIPMVASSGQMFYVVCGNMPDPKTVVGAFDNSNHNFPVIQMNLNSPQLLSMSNIDTMIAVDVQCVDHVELPKPPSRF
jgi:hypothetical protein